MNDAAVAPPRSLAIISPVKDFLFFFLSAAVVLVAWYASSVMHVKGYTILTVVAVVSNGPHLVSTWTRVYLDPREWRARPVPLILVPILVFIAVLLISRQLGTLGARITNSTILYWATWHFVAQNWGILRIYQRKSDEAATSLAMRLEKPLLFTVVLFCLAHRIYTGPHKLFGVKIFHPDLPYPAVLAILVPLIAMLIVVVVQRVRERRAPWAKAAWIRLAFIGCSFLGFFVPFQLIRSDDTSAFAAAACWHGFQYLGMVRYYNKNAWKGGVDPNARLISWLSQPGWTRALLYVALLFAMAGSVYAVVYGLALATGWSFYKWAGIIWVSLTLSHYWIDGVIWKLRRPETAARVGIAPT